MRKLGKENVCSGQIRQEQDVHEDFPWLFQSFSPSPFFLSSSSLPAEGSWLYLLRQTFALSHHNSILLFFLPFSPSSNHPAGSSALPFPHCSLIGHFLPLLVYVSIG
jgi:hypothetical protein